MPKFAANLSMLFTEVPFMERFEQAANVGFHGVEYLFPYPYDKNLLLGQLKTHGLQQVLFNMPPGNWDAGDRGIACHPDRTDEFRAGVEQALDYADALGCEQVNCLSGIIPFDCTVELARDTLLHNLEYAAEQFKSANKLLLIEAINSKVDIPGFYLDTSSKVIELIELLALENIRFQYDVYHMQIMEGDLFRTIERLKEHIGHIQIADNPGRHEPGSGEINYTNLFAKLDALNYQGWVSAEYHPATRTHAGLDWLQKALQA